MRLEPRQSVVLASSSSHNEGTLVSSPLRRVEEMNADVHVHRGPVAPSLHDGVRPPRLMSRFPPHSSHIHDQLRLPSTQSHNVRRAHFNANPVAEVRSIPSPMTSTSSLVPSPPPTPLPLPDVKFSPRPNSPSLSPYPISPPRRVYTPSPIPRAHALPYVPPPPLRPGVHLHPAIIAPNLQYDVRSLPTQSNPHLSLAILAQPASSPPLPNLGLRVGDLPWLFSVTPDPDLSPGKAYVTVQNVVLAIHYHLRTAVKSSEYEAMSKSRKAEIFREFERRVGSDPVQRGKGLRRVDFLNGRHRAQGLVRAHSKDSVWDVVVH